MSIEDTAQEVELKQWEINNKKRPELPTFQPHDTGYGDVDCADCGVELPPARRAHGFCLCVECKSILEKKEKRRC